MEIETIAIIGASELGCRIARFSLLGGWQTILEDSSFVRLEEGIAAIRTALDANPLREGKGSVAYAAVAMPERLAGARSVEEAVRDADLIIEAVADEEELKLELFTIFDKFAKPGAIFASTTEAVAIGDLAEMTFCPERCIGMRFGRVGGEERMTLVIGRATSEQTLNVCRGVGRRMRLQVDELKLGDQRTSRAAH